jgi:hypothetical protein
VRGEHRGVGVATEVIAKSMSTLYPLTTVPSKLPQDRELILRFIRKRPPMFYDD